MHEGENFTENDGSYWLMQPVYDKEYLESIVPKHRRPTSFQDYTGYYGVFALRKSFDLITGYGPNMTHSKWMTRFLFLETVAGVPGMVGAMLRHLRSLRTMRRDNGWIHTLLEEAENERMHLLTFMQMKNPGWLFRFNVIATQGIFLSLYSLFYALSPRHCHAFVSYLEEEAVKTYTHAVKDYDDGKIPEWKNLEVPHIAKKYWRLDDGSTMRDLLLAIRADEACHNHVNAVFAEMKATDPNPFAPGTTLVQ
jgi:threonyl-tRNA synthetase